MLGVPYFECVTDVTVFTLDKCLTVPYSGGQSVRTLAKQKGKQCVVNSATQQAMIF